ncbi:MAG: hypothetical protein PUF37_07855 [Prevotellaceae bacterium]|nr:hypothetical protein [Prevotellaceae bacterium]
MILFAIDDIIGYLALVIFLFVGSVAWIRFRSFLLPGKALELDAYDVHYNLHLLKQALRALNCKYKIAKDHDDRIVRYDYQNGHFQIRIPADSPFVQLIYPFFFTTSADHLEAVRTICNKCNLSNAMCHIIYTSNAEKNVLDVHLTAGLLLTEKTSRKTLERVMRNAFAWQNTFEKLFKAHLEESAHEQTQDNERDTLQFSRELFLLREQELLTQPLPTVERSTEEKPVTLGDTVARIFGLHSMEPLNLQITLVSQQHDDKGQLAEPKMRVLTDSDEIRGLALPTLLYDSDGNVLADEATLLLEYIDLSNTTTRQLSLVLNTEKESGPTSYYRITMTLLPLSLSREVTAESRENRVETVSVLAAYDRRGAEEKTAEFNYMWKEAMAKGQADGKNSDEELTPEERFICHCQDSHAARWCYEGRKYYLAGRFLEALTPLLNAFDVLEGQYDKMDDNQREQFHDLCYMIGFCYCELQRYEEGYFYLNIIMPLNRITYTEEFINCIVNMNDFRAVHYIDGLLMTLEHPIIDIQQGDDDDEEEDEEENGDGGQTAESHGNNETFGYLTAFKNFLRRRKAYALINFGHHEEAEKLLREMLNEPDNSDFAIQELAYLQKIKEEKS